MATFSVSANPSTPDCVFNPGVEGQMTARWPNGETMTVRGVASMVLWMLLSQKCGITSLDCWSNNHFVTTRLSAYIYDLRHSHGLNIEMRRVRNVRRPGTHGRYYLLSPIKPVLPK